MTAHWHDYPHCWKLRDEKDERVVFAQVFMRQSGEYPVWVQGWFKGTAGTLAEAMRWCEIAMKEMAK